MESERERAVVREEEAGAEVEPIGQPKKDYESWRLVDIRIESSLAEYLRVLGGGDISEGVRIVTRFHQVNREGR